MKWDSMINDKNKVKQLLLGCLIKIEPLPEGDQGKGHVQKHYIEYLKII